MKGKKDLPKVEPVQLKEMFGMKPERWLVLAYLAGIVLVVFLFCILPDLLHPFKRVTFTSQFPTAVYVDGDYAGGTEFTKSVDSGRHTATFEVDGTVVDEIDFKVSRPVFLAWLLPRTQTVESNAQMTDAVFDILAKRFLNDAASYSAITEYSTTFRYRELFQEFATAVAGTKYQDKALDIMTTAQALVSTTEMNEDAEKAFSLLGADLSVYKAAKATVSNIDTAKTQLKATSLDEGDFTIEGWDVGSYCIASSRVTETMWAYFVRENPTWAASNKQTLADDGLADTYYLGGVTLSTYYKSTKSVVNISYESALAFCRWLSEKTGKNVFVPTSSQWLKAQASGMKTDSVWEFTSTVAMPSWSEACQKLLESYGIKAEVVVLNEKATAGAASRFLCGDYTGLRLAWTN